MGNLGGRIGILTVGTEGEDLDTSRIVAAVAGILADDGTALARWAWDAERPAAEVAGEIAQTLRTLIALDVPVVIPDAARALSVLNRECRRHRIEPPGPYPRLVDPVAIARGLEPDDDGLTLDAIARRHGLGDDADGLLAGRLARALAVAHPDRLEVPWPELLQLQAAWHGGAWPVVPVRHPAALEDTQPIPLPPLHVPPPRLEVEAAPARPVVHVAAALVSDPDGRGLVVRKRGGEAFIQPGGKIEAGESPLEALVRELREELGVEIDPGDAEYLGVYEAPALNEPGAIVRAETFAVRVEGPLHPGAEIAEIAWIDAPDAGGLPLAPLSRDVLLPMWAERRLTLR